MIVGRKTRNAMMKRTGNFFAESQAKKGHNQSGKSQALKKKGTNVAGGVNQSHHLGDSEIKKKSDKACGQKGDQQFQNITGANGHGKILQRRISASGFRALKSCKAFYNNSSVEPRVYIIFRCIYFSSSFTSSSFMNEQKLADALSADKSPTTSSSER